MAGNSGTCTGRKVFGIVFAILLSIPFIIDIGSDIKLACQYFEEGHIIWGSLTASFILLNWVAQIIASFGVPRRLLPFAPRFQKLAPIFALFGVFPITTKIYSKIGNFSEEESQKLRQAHQSALMVELFCEALPQCMLQVYIVIRVGEYDIFQLISIVTSISSISLSMANGVILYGFLEEGVCPRFTTTLKREIGYQCLVVPHSLFACLGKLVPTVATISYHFKFGLHAVDKTELKSDCDEDGSCVMFMFIHGLWFLFADVGGIVVFVCATAGLVLFLSFFCSTLPFIL